MFAQILAALSGLGVSAKLALELTSLLKKLFILIREVHHNNKITDLRGAFDELAKAKTKEERKKALADIARSIDSI